MDGIVNIYTTTAIIKKYCLYVVVVIETVYQAMHHLLYYKDTEYVNHVIKHLVKIYYLFNNLREESTMLKLSEETRFYTYLSGMLGFLLGVIVTILIISIEHKLF